MHGLRKPTETLIDELGDPNLDRGSSGPVLLEAHAVRPKLVAGSNHLG